MLCNSISVNMKVCALQLKQKSTTGVFHGILRNFRTATFENNFSGAASEKKTKIEKGAHCSLWLQVFTTSRAVIFEITKQSSFSTNFHIAEPFNLDYVIHFYKPKKGLRSPVFTIKILMAEIFGCY